MEHQKWTIVCALYSAPCQPNVPFKAKSHSNLGRKRRLDFDGTSLSNKRRRYMFNETDMANVKFKVTFNSRGNEVGREKTRIRARSQISGLGRKRRLDFDGMSLSNKRRRCMFNETDMAKVKFKVTSNSCRTKDGRVNQTILGSVKNGEQYEQQGGGHCTDQIGESGVENDTSRSRKREGKMVEEETQVNRIEVVAPPTPSPAKRKTARGSTSTEINQLRSDVMTKPKENMLKAVAKRAESAHYYTRLLSKLVIDELNPGKGTSNQPCVKTNEHPNSNGQLTDDKRLLLKHQKKKIQPGRNVEREATKVWRKLLSKTTTESVGDGIWPEVWFITSVGRIQGPRKCVEWRGSVLDSVIGALLTQRVSDTLSSAAFMSLGMIFPQDAACDLYSRNHRMLRAKRSNACSSEQMLVRSSTLSFPHAEGNVSKNKKRVPFDEKNKKTLLKGRVRKKEKPKPDWNNLKKVCVGEEEELERDIKSIDSVDWYAVMRADVEDIAEAISSRGMNRKLASRIKDILNRLVLDHGNLDLEWLRSAEPQEAKDFLLSIYGLGLKSTECVRLLTLRQPAFPVDVNVARVTVRLGWVPAPPVTDDIQMYLLEENSNLHELIHRYLWLRLCKLDKDALYQLHYHMITFGKVFCTKQNPNCSQCPLRPDCRYHSNLHDRPRPALMDIEEWGISRKTVKRAKTTQRIANESVNLLPSELDCIDAPKTPVKDQMLRRKINVYEKTTSAEVRQSGRSRTRTEHYVYELPDWHPILETFDDRDPDDSSPYLLVTWETGQHDFKRTGETSANSTSPNIGFVKEPREVPGSILIPYRTALRANFPLNATYFQTNEVFADKRTSQIPVDVPRKTLQGLSRKTLYCGTSLAELVKGQSANDIRSLFNEGYICTRTFDRETYATRTILSPFHKSAYTRKRNSKR